MTRADKLALAKRCEAATGPCREIDLVIGSLWPEPRPFTLTVAQQRGHLPPCFCFTASLDAVTALIAEKLPGWGWGRDCDEIMFVVHPDYPQCKERKCDGVRNDGEPALSLLAALLRALAEQEDAHV